MVNAINDLVAGTNAPQTKEPTAKVIQPTQAPSAPPLQSAAPSPETTPSENVISPAPAPTAAPTEKAAAQPPATPPEPADDSVAIAHKKVIRPISHPTEHTPNLDELLAKEGITDMDAAPALPVAPQVAPPTPTPSVVTPGSSPAAAPVTANPTSSQLPTTPHPPGHVISPNVTSGVDPNSIAL